MASSPMKKSKSSVPRFALRWLPGPAPPVRKDGLFATDGRPDPEPPPPVVGPLVAMAVGKTKEGESFPAKPEAALSANSTRDVRCDALSRTIVGTYPAWRSRCRCRSCG